MGEESAGTAGAAPMGRYLTLTDPDTGRSEAYCCVADLGEEVAVVPMLPDRAIPQAGQRVACLSSVGMFQTTVRRVERGQVLLAVPAWARRGIRRSDLRVPASSSVRVSVSDRDWSGLLQDVSFSGGSILTESEAGPVVGALIGVGLPSGSAQAAVRSVREHEHHLLVVVGVSWLSLDEPANDWIHAQVQDSRQSPVDTS